VFLVDTNILSGCAPTKADRTHPLIGWMDQNSDRLFLSVVTVAEIEDGIAKAGREGANRKAGLLRNWLDTVLHLYAARILPLDLPVARTLGTLSDRARASGAFPGWADLAIAATAVTHGCIVLTRNLRHFAPTGAPAQNPFEAPP
jgi:predicted nucleic acid-binding protein